MEDDQRTLGVLIEQGRYLTREIAELKMDVKTLLIFRWKIYGMSACIALIGTVIGTVLIEVARAFGN